MYTVAAYIVIAIATILCTITVTKTDSVSYQRSSIKNVTGCDLLL